MYFQCLSPRLAILCGPFELKTIVGIVQSTATNLNGVRSKTFKWGSGGPCLRPQAWLVRNNVVNGSTSESSTYKIATKTTPFFFLKMGIPKKGKGVCCFGGNFICRTFRCELKKEMLIYFVTVSCSVCWGLSLAA